MTDNATQGITATLSREVLQKIHDRYNDTNAGQIQMAAAIFGYSLSQAELKEKEAEIERLKGLIEEIRNTVFDNEAWQQFKTENNL